jgi:hypothetical protein
MRTRRSEAGGGPTVPRLAVVLFVASAVAVMHALGTTGANHQGSAGVMSAVAPVADAIHRADPGRDHAPTGHPSGPEPTSHLLSMTICAFAVLIAARAVLRAGGPRRRSLVPAPQPSIRLVAGPEPPVPRFAV